MAEKPVARVPETIRGFLIDIDGVLYTEKQAIRGAVEAIEFLQRRKYPFLLVTNSTRRSRFALLNNLKHYGFKLDVDQIFSAPFAAAQWLKEKEANTISLYLRGDTYREFKDFRVSTRQPEYLVIGDIGEDLTYSNLNQAFRLVMGGAKMIALQKNRFWQRETGLAVDSGAIVAALEYASQKRAILIGKPNPRFFNQAIKRLGMPAENIAMIGDDYEADVAGGARAGLFTIAVETGKFPKKKHRSSKRKLPHMILPSIGELPDALGK